MFILTAFLTVSLVLTSLFLVLLVLVQLPKKEAGLGQAFGGGATEALFGAGSGNALTKMTKYATIVFLALTMVISILNIQQSKARKDRFERQVQKAGVPPELPAPAATAPATPPAAPAEAPPPSTPATPPAAPAETPPAATPPTPPPAEQPR